MNNFDEKIISQITAKELVLKHKYKKIYTEEVVSNGGNSAKISCPKKYANHKVIVFILGEENA